MPLVSPPHLLGSDFISSRQLQLALSASLAFCFLDPGHFQCTVAFSVLVQRNDSRLCLGINIPQGSPPPRMSLNSAPSVLQSNSESQSVNFAEFSGYWAVVAYGSKGWSILALSASPPYASSSSLVLLTTTSPKPSCNWVPFSGSIFRGNQTKTGILHPVISFGYG